MALKLSIFTTVSDPVNRGEHFEQSVNCYKDLADEVVIVNGGLPLLGYKTVQYKWEQSFSWDFIGQQFQRGYEACTGDWVIHADLDFIFHERDFGRIRQALKDYPNSPAISFYKWQFVLPDRYNLKSRLLIAVNKKVYGDRIKFSGGGDLCQPTLDGRDIDINDMPQAGVPFYNYEKLTKTEAQIIDDVERMDDAYLKYFQQTLYSTDERTAYEGWLEMACGRFNKPQEQIKLSDHPKYIQETIKNLRPDQWGYNGLGHLERNNYA